MRISIIQSALILHFAAAPLLMAGGLAIVPFSDEPTPWPRAWGIVAAAIGVPVFASLGVVIAFYARRLARFALVLGKGASRFTYILTGAGGAVMVLLGIVNAIFEPDAAQWVFFSLSGLWVLSASICWLLVAREAARGSP
jgi:hypothetical protein